MHAAADSSAAGQAKKPKLTGQPPKAPATKAVTAGKKKKTKKEIKAEEKAAYMAAGYRNKPPNFTPDEDVFLSRAFVSVSSEDGTVGTDQSGDVFWKFMVKFTELYYKLESEIVVEGPPRPHGALLTRFQRHIPLQCTSQASTSLRTSQVAGRNRIILMLPVKGFMNWKEDHSGSRSVFQSSTS